MQFTIHVNEDVDYYNRDKIAETVFGSLFQYMMITGSSSKYHNGKWSGSVTITVRPGFEKRVERLIAFI